jgi:YidC/Oxa1 family membrane protein insertase
MLIYDQLVYQPIFNLLIWLYNNVPGQDIGVALILLTIIVKIVLYPLSLKQIKSQKEMQEIQPLMEEIKKKYKDQREKQAQELMALYKKHKVNPAGSCLPLLIQLPFLIAIYQVFFHGFNPEVFSQLYPFIKNPGEINQMFLGVMDLSKAFIPLAFLVGALQFWQAKMMVHNKQPHVQGAQDESMMANMNKQMMYMMPIMTVVIGFSFPSGLVLYWLTTTVLTIIQQYIFFNKHHTPIDPKSNIIEGEKIK